MNIFMPVIGVRGDVQIFLSLAKGLNQNGHNVTVALPEKFHDLAEINGIKTYTFGGDADSGSKEMQQIMNAKSTLAAAKLGVSFFFKGIREHTTILQKLTPGFDLVIGYGNFGLAEADKADKPFISVSIDPAMAEKKLTSNIGLSIGTLIEKIALYFLITKEYYKFRKEIAAPVGKQSKNPQKILLPMSPHIIKRQKNWTQKNLISGYWYLQSSENFEESEELKTFLKNGEKPLFITFGSAGWGEKDNSTLLKICADALKITKSRAVILISKTPIGIELPETIFPVHEIPYQWILKRVSCAVHHCGMGTTAEVLKSGIPSIPVPYMVDQFAWAERIFSIGVSARPIPRKKLTAETLAGSIFDTINNVELTKKAKEISLYIGNEDGIGKAVKTIEEVMSQSDKTEVLY